MKIYSDHDLEKMSKLDLIFLLKELLYNIEDSKISLKNLSKQRLIDIIKNETTLYNKYNILVNEIIDNVPHSFTNKQVNIYKSIFLFLLGYSDKLLDTLNKNFIDNISNVILEKISYVDYPKSKEKLGLLLGGAGTGKTYMVGKIVKKLSTIIGDEKSIQILAPTNKAVKVIKSKIKYCKNVSFHTISKFLEQGIEYTQDGKIIYNTKINVMNDNYKNIKYIIIDEASMISKNNWKDLNFYVFNKLQDVKILLIGDNCQLPPVKETTSIFNNFHCKKFRLTDIMRTQSHEISNIYQLFREIVLNNDKLSSIKSIKSGQDFKYINSVNEYISNFDIENDKIISYSNESVDKYNQIIRNKLFDNPEEEYVIGEKVIFGSTVKISNITTSLFDVKYVYSNDEATIMHIEKISINTIYTYYTDIKFNIENIFPEKIFDVYKLYLRLENGEFLNVFRLEEHSKNDYEIYFKEIYEKITAFSKNKNIQREYISKIWDIYYTVKNTINIPIKYSYALTVYKSQGSTFKKIFVDIEDICLCVKDNDILSKSIYTAVSRGSEKIYCYYPTLNDYYEQDIIQYPALKKYNKLDNSKIYKVLKDAQNIYYTKNDYNVKNKRKLVRAKVIHIIDKDIHVGNGDFKWVLKIKDDIIVYL